MDGALPGLPKIYFGVVDVRDIADLHLRAMTAPEAKGERFLGVAGDFLSMRDIARVLKCPHGCGGQARPDPAAAELAGPDRRTARSGRAADPPGAGQDQECDQCQGQAPARLVAAISNDDCIVATAESLMRLQLLKDSRKAAE